MKPKLKYKVLFITINILVQILLCYVVLTNDLIDIGFPGVPGNSTGDDSSFLSSIFWLISPILFLVICSIVWKVKQLGEITIMFFLTLGISFLFWTTVITVTYNYRESIENKNTIEFEKRRAVVHRNNLDLIIGRQEYFKIVGENNDDEIFRGYYIASLIPDTFLIYMSDQSYLNLEARNTPPVNICHSTEILTYSLNNLRPFMPDTIFMILNNNIATGKVDAPNCDKQIFSALFKDNNDYPCAHYSLDLYKEYTVYNIWLSPDNFKSNEGLKSLFFLE